MKSIDNKIIFMSFQGELGWFVLYIRLIYSLKCVEKVVCCKRGEEFFFPNVTSFIYDYPIITSSDKEKKGTRILPEEIEFKKQFEERYPDYFIFHASYWRQFYGLDYVPIEPQKTYNLKCDIVIGPRLRLRRRRKN